ncbi:MAG: prolyl oligopeptidase family protein [Mariniblastus sp.]
MEIGLIIASRIGQESKMVKRTLLLILLSFFTIGTLMAQDKSSQPKVSDVTEAEDPYLWLEDVTGEKQLDWVRERNKKTQNHFEGQEDFNQLTDDLLKILDSDERIPFVSKAGDHFYNFWRDKTHVRGIWRRTSLEEYRKADPKWETVLDLDELAKTENENWVWGGSSILRPGCERALISFSRGGADASVTREFDMKTMKFVENGFTRPEAKGGIRWVDRDTVFVFTDFGEGSMTSSGYPRIVKLWRRGTDFDAAETVYEGKNDDMYISGMHDDSPGFERNFVSRTLAFYNDELYLRADDGKLSLIEAPNSANKSVYKQYLMLELRKPWDVGGKSYSAGSLLVTNFEEFMAGKREFEVLFEPSLNTSLANFSACKDHIILNVLEDVKNRIYVLTPESDKWKREPLKGAPEIGTVSVSPVDPDHSNAFWMTSSGYLTPTTLFYGEIGSEPEQLKQLTPLFDAKGLQVQQHFATSKDGTRVPYFMVAKKDVNLDGNNPTLLYGYGGFEISLTPGYSASVGRAWTSQGGVYVVANIRGGGEYGPRWHQAALQENRLRAYEDFAAVGQDLISRKVTSRERLGIQGGSNGGLLVGNMVALYPDLFGAAVCQVPLLDMRRYHLLLAGASWMAEYGNPDEGNNWDFIKTYSPYQNIDKAKKYPAVLFTTSTRDDRVHPGHARKMMALMEAQGHDVTYYENIEGGHGGAANNKQRAYMQSLAYSFLKGRLFGDKKEQ